MKKTDEELMAEYKLGSKEALEELFQRYKIRLLNYALRLMNNRADAEDIVGDVFCVVTGKKDSYKPQAKLSTWLYTVAHNACVDKIRKKARIIFLWRKKDKYGDQYQAWDIPDQRPFPSQRAEAKEIALRVKREVSKLPLAQKEALILREYDQMHYQEIARVLSCSVSKVKILIFRARQRLQKRLLPFIKEENNV